MGLFNKFKKDNKVEEFIDEVEDNSTKLGEPAKDNKKSGLENEINDLQDEIRAKNERLSNIIEKIDLSKKEYDEIVGKIIESKKELRLQENSGSNANNLSETMNQDKNKILMEINNSTRKLKQIQDEIEKNSEINEELEQKIKKNEPAFSDTETRKK